MAALEFVKITTSSAANDERFNKKELFVSVH